MAKKYGFGEHDGNMPPTPDRSDITCPFCGDGDFDLEGLKHHFRNGYCVVYEATAELPTVFNHPAQENRIGERAAVLIAHRACCGTEHNPLEGKLHGYCVVCGVPWPCEYAGTPDSVADETRGAG